MAVNVVFECLKVDKRTGASAKLNSVKFSSKMDPGYCLGMSVDWARTTLTVGAVKSLDALHPMEWPIIQSAYEVASRLSRGGPDAIGAIEGNGLEVTNFDAPDAKGNEIPFNQDFHTLSVQLAGLVGTYIVYLGGGPGGGGHFMGFRRLGAGGFILGEWFDPNDCLMQVTSGADWQPYIEGMLNHAYSGRPTSHCDLRQYCCVAKVERPLISSMTPPEVQGIGKARFAALKDAFARGVK